MSQKLLQRLAAIVASLWLLIFLAACGGLASGNARSSAPLPATVRNALTTMGSAQSEGTMIRIFKESAELEVWKETGDGTYRLFKIYEICAYSGVLGPKIREGDRQAPEGFYTITPGLMHPNSNYYLAFNTGFPNKYDRAYGRTGSNLMVHGDCSSSGCYSMTDESIAEIYALVRESFAGGNPSVQLQIYPFRMTPRNMARHRDSEHWDYWQNIKTGYDYFEITRRPPTWDVCGRDYVFNATGPGGAALDATAACPVLSRDSVLLAQVDARNTADLAAMQTELAALEVEQEAAANAAAQAAAVAQQEEAERLALQQRGEAIGGFFGGLFGGGQPPAAQTPAPGAAPQPLPAPSR